MGLRALAAQQPEQLEQQVEQTEVEELQPHRLEATPEHEEDLEDLRPHLLRVGQPLPLEQLLEEVPVAHLAERLQLAELEVAQRQLDPGW